MEELKGALGRFQAAAWKHRLSFVAADVEQARVSMRELSGLILPRQLPLELVWFWENVDTSSPALQLVFPPFWAPNLCVALADVHWAPKALLPIAERDEASLLIELSYETSPGPAIYFYDSDAGLIEPVASGLAEVFDALAAGLKAERFSDRQLSLRDLLPGGALGATADSTISEVDLRIFDTHDARTWPARWLAEEGIEPNSWLPTNERMTVAAFQAERKHGPVIGTLVGRIRRIGGSTAGSVLKIEDDSGEVGAYKPRAVHRFGTSESGLYEIDVEGDPAVGAERLADDLRSGAAEVQRLALSGDLKGAAHIGARMGHAIHGHHPVIVTAMRPLDEQ